MADYDWFDKTPAYYVREAEYQMRLSELQYKEEGWPDKTLVCLLCGSVVYGTLDDKYARLHRTVCRKVTSGKHRAQ